MFHTSRVEAGSGLWLSDVAFGKYHVQHLTYYSTGTLMPAYAVGVPVGSKVLLVINEEVRVPVTRRLGIVGFVDAGNTFTGPDTFSFLGLKVGTGAGVRFETAVAVLRLDMGLPLPPPPGSPRVRWHLSIGQAF
jgi:outer membrane translocation and assembly module TamA